MDRRAASIALLFLGSASCGGPASRDDSPVVLRVSAVHGMSKFALGPDASGSTTYALDLVYDSLPQHAEIVSREGGQVILRRRKTSPYSAVELGAALRFEGLVSARARGEEIVCELSDPIAAAEFVAVPAGFDLGPFALAAEAPGRVRLVARAPLAIDAIEILELDGSEEWRRLLAHELDVIPNAAALYRGQFAGMTSVRILDLPVTAACSLFFNTADPALGAARVRRALATALDPVAVARISCGSADCAVGSAIAPAEATPLPARVSLLALDSEPFPLAAGVIRHQLWSAGVEVEVELLGIDDIRERCQAGRFQLALLALPSSGAAAATSMVGENISNYHSDDLDRAVADQDFPAALHVLSVDVPALPIHELRQFAAVDSRFCGGQPDNAASWRWLAALRPCAEADR